MFGNLGRVMLLDKQPIYSSAASATFLKPFLLFKTLTAKLHTAGFHSLSRKGTSNCKSLLFRALSLGVVASSFCVTQNKKNLLNFTHAFQIAGLNNYKQLQTVRADNARLKVNGTYMKQHNGNEHRSSTEMGAFRMNGLPTALW